MLKCVDFDVNQPSFYFFGWNRRKLDCQTPGETRDHCDSQSPPPTLSRSGISPGSTADRICRFLGLRSELASRRQKKNAFDEPVFCGFVEGIHEAERSGFEPEIPLAGYTGLAIRRFRPLSHLSGAQTLKHRPTVPPLCYFQRGRHFRALVGLRSRNGFFWDDSESTVGSGDYNPKMRECQGRPNLATHSKKGDKTEAIGSVHS
jgi:hypothetical protein